MTDDRENFEKASERLTEVALRLLKDGAPSESGLSMERMSEEHQRRVHAARLLRNLESK